MAIASRVLLSVSGHACSRLSRTVAAVLVGWGVALHGGAAYAAQGAVDEVEKLLEQGKAAQAAKAADDYLKQNPGDVQMRFMQGVIAVEQKQNTQAITVFTALTRDYPTLPEPYNNLAVLYAAQGQERKAAEVLEQAIRVNPGYATAHENLGDLYARMASDAYSRALQLEGGRQSIEPKLALIAQIFPKRRGTAKPAAQVAAASATKAAAVEPKPATAPVAEAKAVVESGPVVPRVEEKKPELPQAMAAAPSFTAKPAADVPAPSAEGAAAAEVEAAVNAWVQALSGQDAERYLGAYSETFAPADGSSFAKWKEVRRQRMAGKSALAIALRDLKVSVNGDQAEARFLEEHAGGILTMKKTLKLQRENGRWCITREGAGA